jgi:hypothetical protein
MKKFALTLLGAAVLMVTYAAQPIQTTAEPTHAITVADPVDLNQYAGKYKFEGLPFEYVTIAVKDGKLTIDTGTDSGELTPMKEEDSFDAAGQATLIFMRDADKKVTGLTLKAQGFDFAGKKEA